jgi:hypothetical protein
MFPSERRVVAARRGQVTGGQFLEQCAHRRERCDVVHGHVPHRALGHARLERLPWVSHDGDASATLDGLQSGRSIVEGTGQDANHRLTIGEGGGAEGGVDRRPAEALLRTAGEAQVALLDEQVEIGRAIRTLPAAITSPSVACATSSEPTTMRRVMTHAGRWGTLAASNGRSPSSLSIA